MTFKSQAAQVAIFTLRLTIQEAAERNASLDWRTMQEDLERLQAAMRRGHGVGGLYAESLEWEITDVEIAISPPLTVELTVRIRRNAPYTFLRAFFPLLAAASIVWFGAQQKGGARVKIISLAVLVYAENKACLAAGPASFSSPIGR